MKFDGADDVTLVKLVAAGNTDAIQELYNRYHRLVFSVALAVLGDRAVAEEATLDVFVRVWQGAGSYRSDRAKVNTWLVAITRHHAIDILRWQSSRPDTKSLSLSDLSWGNGPAVPDTEERVETDLQRARVRNAVAQLPADQQQALVLAYFKGYTHSQIADVLKQPLGTVKTRIRLAMQKLRELLLDETLPPDSRG